MKKSIKKNLVQGLFGELCIISISSNANYLIKSWHTSPNDKYDFNDGHEKLEVKTTDNLERIHSFSMNQTNSFDKTVIIASVITTQTDMGLSVFDLVKKIQCKLIEDSMNQKLNEIILKTLGSDFKGASRYFFDYKQAIESIKYYNSQDIPMILSSDLDSRISRVKYDCKIEGIKEMKLKVKSKLQALLI